VNLNSIEDVQSFIGNIDLTTLKRDELLELNLITDELQRREKQEGCRKDFLTFVRTMWSSFIEGAHHRIMCEQFNKIARGELRRVIINMAPRHSKSEMSSYMLPSWLLGIKPDLKIIQATHTGELAVRFGRKVRDLVDTREYKEIFPDVSLRADSKAAGRWETTEGGEYFASGVGGAITGRGADILIIDDPHSEQDALSETAMDMAYEWYTSGPRQRLQPGGTIILVMTRWSKKDLTGQLLKAQMSDLKADKWELIEFPAIMPSGKPVWEEFWKIEELEGIRASLPHGKWAAQWMQEPTGGEGAIIKKEWINIWEKSEPPVAEYIIQSYDTAFLKSERADYSAITTWGVFYKDEGGEPNIILLDSIKDRYDFPELKEIAYENYIHWDPDVVIIEAKASGLPLTQELRKMGIPVQNYSPNRGQDKIVRANAVAPLFESGMVWVPETRWAEELVEELTEFPNGEHDDLVDSTTQALLRFRQGGFLKHPKDYEDEPLGYEAKSFVYY
jgi:predicted phage terminase large subunit-like protein|tara:strand:+ start:15028 stop:16539 length:1512 start_codon:yes stop_codon:yes gene_type:complete